LLNADGETARDEGEVEDRDKGEEVEEEEEEQDVDVTKEDERCMNRPS